MTVALGGKTFVSASGPGQAISKKATTNARRWIAPAPVSAEVTAQNEREALQALLRRQTATKSFSPPNGDVDWGRRLYEADLGIEECVTDGMTEGWLQAANQGKENEILPN